MIITMKHVRRCGVCSNGCRDFFKRYGLDWSDFLKNGIDSSEIEHIDNAIVKRIIKEAENNG